MSKFIRYAGYADKPSHEQSQAYPAWAIIEDTEEAIQEAISKGYTAISTTSFSRELVENSPEPIRKGNLIFDIDSKEGELHGIKIAQHFVRILYDKYGVSLRSMRCWVSGGKGCHIEIPAEVFGAEQGDMYLPNIYKKMVKILCCTQFRHLENYIDSSLYCMGKGKLLRVENVMRSNERYKVPVSVEELYQLRPQELALFAEKPRNISPTESFEGGDVHIGLKELYLACKNMENNLQRNKYPISVIESFFNCQFVKHCIDNAKDLSEEHWFAMLAVFSQLGRVGKHFAHAFSVSYPGYSFEETEKKWMHVSSGDNKTKKMSCGYIKTIFPCDRDCSVSFPGNLWTKTREEEFRVRSNYILNNDGLFLRSNKNDKEEGSLTKVCSSIKVLSKTCGKNKMGWGRRISIETPLGEHQLQFSMRDIAKPETFLGDLLDAGLEIDDLNFAKKHIPTYVMNAATSEGVVLKVGKIGWHEQSYILPDKVFGSFDTHVEFDGVLLENFYQTNGSLAEWKEHIGNLCQGNSLLVFLTAMAFCGPLLKLCSEEGVGVNIYGPSSAGKTTCALVTGSVCGGGGRNGFIRSWRTTDNALEATACLHNDGLLILDELGQATGDSVGRTVYMLANGEAKTRMTSEAKLRETSQWRTNILSTGEITMPEKIRESGKFKSMAGQEVRMVDLPLLGVNGEQVFENLHGIENGAQFSKLLSERSKQYYGAPLHEFLQKLCLKQEESVDSISLNIAKFEKEYIPSDSSGQLQRVGRKFALIAAAGELAREFGILPYKENEVFDAAVQWFKIWLDKRPGLGNLEVEKSIEKIHEMIQSHGMSKFVDVTNVDSRFSELHHPANYLGYKWEEEGCWVYFILSPVFTSLCTHRDAVEKELIRRGVVKLNKKGKIMETKSVKGENQRGVGILVPKPETEQNMGKTALIRPPAASYELDKELFG